MGPKKGRKKGNFNATRQDKFAEIFKEKESSEKRAVDEKDSGKDEDDDEDAEEDVAREKGVPLFDIDLYGRNIHQGKTTGFGKPRRRTGITENNEELDDDAAAEDADDTWRETNEDQELDDEDNEWSEDNDEEKEAERLGRAFLDEWEYMALDRVRDAAEYGDAYSWVSGGSAVGRPEGGDPYVLPRLWESSFYLTALQNIENKPQYFFYVITFEHVNKQRKITGALRRRVLYSPGFHLKGGAYKALHAPLPIWPKKMLPVAYADLHNYAVTIDLWMISEYTFNTLYASTTLTLKDALDSDPETSLVLQRKLPTKKRAYEVQRLKIAFQIAEVFDFDLFFESWSYTAARHVGPEVMSAQKYLKFTVPKGAGMGWKSKKTSLTTTAFWSAPFSFVFRGTLQQLQNSYFVVKVYMKAEGSWFQRDPLIGTCIMSLRSVTTYPVFRSMVKQLTLNEELFNQGDLSGNIRCYTRSAGLPYYEDPAIVKRPEQRLAGAALVTQLDYREQFLVVRLFKCENLPAANVDSGTSDPVVKVKWDGMTNTSTVKQSTVRPIWNQNLYFPIRLLDPSERTVPVYIQKCLPLDLLSKGNIVFECWDQDETSSDYLGGTEVHFSDIVHKGVPMTRCLAEGLGQADASSARLPDGRPAAFVYEGADDVATEPADVPPQTVQPFEKTYVTMVYSGQAVELTGSTLPSAATAKPCIFFEIFCIPPLPAQLELPAPLPAKEEQDLWKQWTKRWERDYHRWLRIYAEWFPAAPSMRRFLCTVEHPQTRRLHPLPAFLTPIAIPEQIAGEGELLHWISNMTFLVSQKQRRTGLLPRWLSPNYFLMSRKGGVNDHAVLLCSCLLGLDYDAYVCKGTIADGTLEHCWVMTRHEDGWVTFYEATTKKRYHLPQRWRLPRTSAVLNPPGGPALDFAADENPYYTDAYLQACFQQAAAQTGVDLPRQRLEEGTHFDVYGEDVVADVDEARLELEIWDHGKNSRAKAHQHETQTDRDRIREWIRSQLDLIPIAPKQHLLDPEATLAYVPYSSIEVIFNHEQLWGNLQNHHPAVITYDLEDPYLWRPFLTEKPNPIDSLIFVAPSTRDKSCEILSSEIQADVAENIRVFRSRKGLETLLDHSTDKTERLEKYLDLLEFRMRLDPEFDCGPPPGHEGWSAWGTYDSTETTRDYDTSWYDHLEKDPNSLRVDPETQPNQVQYDDVTGYDELAGGDDMMALKKTLPQSAYGPHALAPARTTPDYPAAGPPAFSEAAQHGAALECASLSLGSTNERSDSFRTAVGLSRGSSLKSFETAYTETFQNQGPLFSPSTFGKSSSSSDVCSRGLVCDEDEFGSSSESNTSNGSGDHDILEYCRRRRILLAGPSASQSRRPPQAVGDMPVPWFVAEGRSRSSSLENVSLPAGPLQCNNNVSDNMSGCMSGSPLPPAIRSIESCFSDATLLLGDANGSEKDEYWEAFEKVYNEAGVALQLNPQHGMMMEDYEEFESRRTAAATPQRPSSSIFMTPSSYDTPPSVLPSASTVPSVAEQRRSGPPPRPPRPDDTYYSLIQKPGKTSDAAASEEGVDVTQLGFTIEEHPAGAVLGRPARKPIPEQSSSLSPHQEQQHEPTSSQPPFLSRLPQESPSSKQQQQQPPPPLSSSPSPSLGRQSKDTRAPLPPSTPTEVGPPLLFSRPVVATPATADQQAKWGYYYRMEALYYQWQKLRFPVRPCHTFCGFPLHLSTTDASDIRTFLLASRRFRKVIDIKIDGVTYVVRWCEIHWAGKEQRQTRMRRRRPKPKRSKLKP